MVIPMNIIAFIVNFFSQNVNYIEAHNKSLSHVRFVKVLQQKIYILNNFQSICFCFFFGIVTCMMGSYSYH
jgi:hypothetical protein